MKNTNQALLFIFSGLPATGKTTLAKFVAKEFNAVYLRIDTIEQGLRDLCKIKVEGEGYRLTYKIAEDNLKLNINVVADSCNPIALTREEWENVAKTNHCDYINIEVTCSDKDEHKKRTQHRISEIENLKPPLWEEIENREYHKWQKERIVIDTANKAITESELELKQKIMEEIARKKSCN